MELREKKCIPCEGEVEPLNKIQIIGLIKKLSPRWQVVENSILTKEFPFENFKREMAFTHAVALIAEEENHHPNICINYNRVTIELSTHAIDGLSENDFIMAAKIDNL